MMEVLVVESGQPFLLANTLPLSPESLLLERHNATKGQWGFAPSPEKCMLYIYIYIACVEDPVYEIVTLPLLTTS